MTMFSVNIARFILMFFVFANVMILKQAVLLVI